MIRLKNFRTQRQFILPEVELGPPAMDAMVAWYRGDSLVGSGTATGWNDKTGNGYNLPLYSGGTVSISNSANFNDKPVAIFNSSGFFEVTDESLFTTTFNNNPITIVSFHKIGDFEGESYANRIIVGTESFLSEDWDSVVQLIYRYGDIYGDSYAAATYDSFWNFHFWEWVPDPVPKPPMMLELLVDTTATVYGNSVRNVEADTRTIIKTAAQNRIKIGGNYINAAHFIGEIAEVIIYNKLLDSGERNELWNYAQEYYGLGG